MVIKRTFKATCKACGRRITLREYEGLEGSRYGDHFCVESREFWINHPRVISLVRDVREVKK